MKNAGKACNNRLYRHIRTFEKIIKNYFVIFNKCVNRSIRAKAASLSHCAVEISYSPVSRSTLTHVPSENTVRCFFPVSSSSSCLVISQKASFS